MEEAVTRKFVHEESGSITSLCGKILMIFLKKNCYYYYYSKLKLLPILKLLIHNIVFIYTILSD